MELAHFAMKLFILTANILMLVDALYIQWTLVITNTDITTSFRYNKVIFGGPQFQISFVLYCLCNPDIPIKVSL